MNNQDLVEVIKQLIRACDTLMDEVCRQKATDWGIVNDAMVAGQKAIKQLLDKK